MSDELQNPPVVDLDLIFQPIAGDNPAGESLRYSGLYDEMREARRADEDLAQGEWQTELKVADYPKALNLGIDALSTKSKDLQVAAWTCEALVSIHGFAGFRDGLKILAGLQEHFWEQLYPEIDEGDMESRANALAWVDSEIAITIKGAPFTGVAAYSYMDWEDSKKYDFPDNIDSLSTEERERVVALKEVAEKDRKVTAELWRKEIAQTRRAPVESVYSLIQECFAALAEVNRMIEEKFDRNQAPSLGVLKKSLDDVEAQVKALLTIKRAEEPDEVFDESGEFADGEAGAEGGPGRVASGAINSRRDALNRLNDIAEFFKRTEPHSPVAYLVQRAVKWGDMPLDMWLQEVVKDPGVLYQLRETLGVMPGTEG
jgi:type VI secretion system protein ImpA